MRFLLAPRRPPALQAHGAGRTFPNGESHEINSGSNRAKQLYRLLDLGELVPTVSLMRFLLAPRGACNSTGSWSWENLSQQWVSWDSFWLQECHSALQAHVAGGTCPNSESHESLSGSQQLNRLIELGELFTRVSLLRFSLAPRGPRAALQAHGAGGLFPTLSLMRFSLAPREACRSTGSWSWGNLSQRWVSWDSLWLKEGHADLQAHGAGGTCPNGESHEILSGSKRIMQLIRRRWSWTADLNWWEV